VLEERTRFVLDHDSEQYTMAELCRIYGIARKTGYQWVKRYETEGLSGLPDRRYGAGNHPNQTDAAIEEQIVQLHRGCKSFCVNDLR
jgi:putative transposase